jgi:hypothetical protein
MHETMNQMVSRSASGWSNQDSGKRLMRLPIDAYSTDNEIIVTAALAGVMPEKRPDADPAQIRGRSTQADYGDGRERQVS